MSAQWKETIPGRFERPLDSIELFFSTLAAGGAPLGREHWAISVVGKFHLKHSASDSELEGALRQAWKTMRYDHPEIASFVTGGIKIYEVAEEAAVKNWLAETFIIEPLTASISDLLASFQPKALATCHYLPHTSEILIHSSHWRMDGIGSISLLGNFFQAFAAPRDIVFGDEGMNLTASLDEIAGFETDKSPEAEESSTALLMEYFGNLPTIGLPTEGNQIPGATHRSEIVLGQKTTAALVAGCRAHNLTVASAMHAASVMATIALNSSQSTGGKYTSFGAINYRPYLPAPHSDPKRHPVSVNMLGLPISLTPSTFAETAMKLKQFYHQPLSLSETNFRSIISPYTRKFTTLAVTPPPPGMPQPSEATLNSVGIVDGLLDRFYGDNIEISNFWLGVEMLSRQLDFYVWTWQSKMVLSGCYNSEFFTDDFTVAFYRNCVDVLNKELQLELGEDWSL
jgi:hypothetical protein